MTESRRAGLGDAAINLSMVWRGLPLNDALGYARCAGFRRVESWWPFDSASPERADIDDFTDEIMDSGMTLLAMNLYAGPGHRGRLGTVDSEEELYGSAVAAAAVAAHTGCRLFTVPYGSADEIATDHRRLATERAKEIVRVFERQGIGDVTLLLEPLSVPDGRHPLADVAMAAGLAEAVNSALGGERVRLLLDIFHLVRNGDDPIDIARRFGALTAHVQLAAPDSRGVPIGVGSVDSFVRELEDGGYSGSYAYEFEPGNGNDVERLAATHRNEGITR